MQSQNANGLGGLLTRTWGEDQALAAGLIFSVAQTRDGYLWLASERGLLRFDGVQFRAVPLDGMPAGSPVLEVLAEQAGTLWILTPGARLMRLEPGSQIAHALPLLQADSVLAMAPAPQGGILVSSASHGLLRLKGDKVQDYGTKGPSLVIAVAQAGPGSLWLGTRGVGLYQWSHGVSTPVGASVIDNKVNRLLPGRDGRLWVGTDRGLFVWDGQRAKAVRLSAAAEPLQVLSLLQDAEGMLWVGTSQGLLRLQPDGLAAAAWVRHSGLAVTALLADREGDIWFGDGSRLQRLQEPAVMPIDLPPAVMRNGIGPVAVDRHGRIWFAPLDGGLFWTADGRTPHRISNDGISHDTVYSIDCRGESVWIGRQKGGLTRLQEQSATFSAKTWSARDGLPQNSVYAVRATVDGTVWSGSLTGGLSHLVDGHFEHFGAAQTGSDTIAAIEVTPEGSVWVATPVGLARYRNGVWQRGMAASGLPSQEVLSLLSSGDKLLVGTTRGAVEIDPMTDRVTALAPAVHDPVLGLAVGAPGRLWMSTTDQLLSTNLPSAGSADSPTIRSYDKRDALPNPAGVRRTRSMIADAQGQILLATTSGLSTIRPIAESPFVPALAHVVSVLADETPVPRTAHFHVPPNTKRTTLSFDALDFRAPEQVRVRYKLEGFDGAWSEPTTTRQVSYTNLGPGEYTFRILAQNSRGEWSQSSADQRIQVEPTLLQRWSFRIACCVVLVVMCGLLYRSRMQAVLRQATVLADERIAERNRIARELHDTLLQGFISVMMHLHVTSERIPKSSPTRQPLDQVLGMMEHVIEEARLTVQGLRGSESDMPELETTLATAGKTLGAGSLTVYEFRVVGQKRQVHPVVVEELGRIGMEAISNAFRHAHASRLDVLLDYARTRLELRICDDGDGIDAAVLAHGKAGHWGICGMRERAKHIGAHLHIHSGEEGGSTVSLTVAARLAYHSER